MSFYVILCISLYASVMLRASLGKYIDVSLNLMKVTVKSVIFLLLKLPGQSIITRGRYASFVEIGRFLGTFGLTYF